MKHNGQSYGRYTGNNAETLARANYDMRMAPRPKAAYIFELYCDGIVKESGISKVGRAHG